MDLGKLFTMFSEGLQCDLSGEDLMAAENYPKTADAVIFTEYLKRGASNSFSSAIWFIRLSCHKRFQIAPRSKAHKTQQKRTGASAVLK